MKGDAKNQRARRTGSALAAFGLRNWVAMNATREMSIGAVSRSSLPSDAKAKWQHSRGGMPC